MTKKALEFSKNLIFLLPKNMAVCSIAKLLYKCRCEDKNSNGVIEFEEITLNGTNTLIVVYFGNFLTEQ